MGDTNKTVSKTYKLLLKWYTADELVKEQMIKWAMNINAGIEMEQWEHLWKKITKISVCITIQENCYNIFLQVVHDSKQIG